jgi:hypothetical protein
VYGIAVDINSKANRRVDGASRKIPYSAQISKTSAVIAICQVICDLAAM